MSNDGNDDDKGSNPECDREFDFDGGGDSDEDAFRSPPRKRRKFGRFADDDDEDESSSSSDDDEVDDDKVRNDGSDENEDDEEEGGDEIETMMKTLTDEAESGKFRALSGKYAKLAVAWQQKRIAGRVPGVSAAFSTELRNSKIRIGDPPGSSGTKKPDDGMLVATGCTKLVSDEHGCYVQFSARQLDAGARDKMKRQRATGFSMEYAMTRFRIDDAIDVYYSGNDPLGPRESKAEDAGANATAPSPLPPAKKFCVVAFPEIAKKYLTCPDDAEVAQSKEVDSRPSPTMVHENRGTIDAFFRRRADDGRQTRPTPSQPSAPPPLATSAARPKHKKFDRDMFYVRAQDVYCSRS